MAEQWWTTVLLGTTAEETGPDLPAHGGNGCDPEQAMAEEVVHIDAEMVRRYAEVSGDFSEHHFDAEAARRSGFAGPFLHGLCTMALCARAVVGVLCPDDPSRLRRFAVQFASPAYLDEDLTVRICASRRGPLRLRGDVRGQRRHPQRVRRASMRSSADLHHGGVTSVTFPSREVARSSHRAIGSCDGGGRRPAPAV